MKKLILLALVLCSAATMLAQTNRMSYQAVVRNAANELVAEENLTVAIRISDASSTAAYSETHSVTSNRNGVISLMIGEGSGHSGILSSVDWRTAQIHTVITLPGGATLSNTTPVNAVPYAFYADSVDTHWVNDVVDDYLEHHSISSIVETDPTVPDWAKEANKPSYDYSEIGNTPTIPTVPTNVSAFDNDAHYITETQLNDAHYITTADVPAQTNADWEATSGVAQILNKPTSVSAFDNDANYVTETQLNDAHYITAADVPVQTNADWEATSGVAEILNKPTNVSTFNNDANYVTETQLNDAHYITAADVPAQVNADWEATSGVAEILNKPTNVSAFDNDANYITAADIAGLLNTVNELNRKVDSLEDVVANMSEPPVLETVSVSDVGIFKATFHGNITSEGFYSVTARGFCYGTSENPTIGGNFTSDGTGEGAFSHTVTALQANTTYYVRAYVTNSMGTTYGNQLSFITKNIPTVTTAEISDITNTTATCGGEIVADEGITISARGVCWGTSPNPTISNAHTNDGNGTGVFTSSLTELILHTTYHIRAYITTNEGIFYGNELTFTTDFADNGQPCTGSPTVTDHEGNVYATVQIGTQCWMKENLRTTTSPSTGTYLIPAANIGFTFTGKQARWYNNDSTTYASMHYGLLYNWNAAVDTFNTAYGETSVYILNQALGEFSVTFSGHRRGICPMGWHLPSDAEWSTLFEYVGNQTEYACDNNTNYFAKAFAFETGWNPSNQNCAVGNDQAANNSSGFSAVPAGYYSDYGFGGLNRQTSFWSSTSENQSDAYSNVLYYYSIDNPTPAILHKYGSNSVRCVKD